MYWWIVHSLEKFHLPDFQFKPVKGLRFNTCPCYYFGTCM